MYCTTFPCHMCAKHIVSSGITELKYIEPYPKSYAEQLHSDSIYVGVKHCGEKRTVFSPFIGISPHRFRDLFERGKRKDHKGTFSDWIHGSPHLIVSYTIATYLKNEEAFIKDFKDKADALAKAEKLSTAVEPPQEAPKQS